MSVTATAAWHALARHAEIMRATPFGAVIAGDTTRLRRFDVTLDGLRFNYAFQNITDETIQLLTALAKQQKVAEWRARMFAGEPINTTEKRAVLHTALRRADDAPTLVNGLDVMAQIRTEQKRVAAFVDAVRSGIWRGATGKPIRHVVNIGIGGSDLGPRMAALALRPFVSGLDVHFVANIDAFELDGVLSKIDAEQTLFVVVSKTFTTQDTVLNAQSARRWLVEKQGKDAVARHFVAVSANRDEVEKFGIPTANMFRLWDWVGGRYSLWSAVGLSLSLAIGNDHFRAFLAGAAAMDAHFQTAPLSANIPVLMALLGVWNRNFYDMPMLAVLPYCERLREMPRYLQQLEMESNGKSVSRAGAPVDYHTAPALFGECGTVGQHSFHQWLHQGSAAIAADFIAVAHDDMNRPDHHRALFANMVAQIAALAFGQSILGHGGAATPYDICPGGRPSSLVLLDRLTPYTLGMLLALYEHKAFVQGVIWEINSFDQPGVELGKRMAKKLEDNAPSPGAGGTTASIVDAFFRILTG